MKKFLSLLTLFITVVSFAVNTVSSSREQNLKKSFFKTLLYDEFSFQTPVTTDTTNCEVVKIPFNEGFNTGSLTKACWKVVNANNDDKKWDLNYNETPYEGDFVATIKTHQSNGQNDDWLISPKINLSSTPGAKRLRFYFRVQGTFVPSQFRVMLSTTGDAVDKFTRTLIPLETYKNNYYIEKVVDLSDENAVPYQGDIHIAFHVPPTGAEPPSWMLYIDNVIVEDVPSCEALKSEEIRTCPGSTNATLWWKTTPEEKDVLWEYIVAPSFSVMPNKKGVLLDKNSVEITDLQPNKSYDFWIRKKCKNKEGYSAWIKKEFMTSVSNLREVRPFCADSKGIVFENMNENTNVPSVNWAGFHCLSETPYPVWYYLKVKDPGKIEMEIVQNIAFDAQGNPSSAEGKLDVDFAAFGPFESTDEFCPTMNLEVGKGDSNPLIDCSFSPRSIEKFTIENAQKDKLYLVLITNYKKKAGYIKLVQKNLGQPGAGSTDCSFLCQVNLGKDIVGCPGSQVELEAKTSEVINKVKITSIQWFKDGSPMDTDKYNTLKIKVKEPGVYKVKVAKNNCINEVIEDEIKVSFASDFPTNVPSTFTVCDKLIDNKGTIPFDEFIKKLNLNETFKASFFINEEQAHYGFKQFELSEKFKTEETKVFLRIQSTEAEKCYKLYAVDIKFNNLIEPKIKFSYPNKFAFKNGTEKFLNPILEEGFTKGGTFESTQGLSIDKNTGQINPQKSKIGKYEVVYNYKALEGTCGGDKQYKFTLIITNDFNIKLFHYCKSGKMHLQAINNFESSNNYQYKWKNASSTVENNAILLKAGKVDIEVSDAFGFKKSFSFNIEDSNCLLSKGISPNADGLNDSFDLTNYHPKSVHIFNRFGKEVYSHSDGYTNQWHGQSNGGQKLPDGTYFYKVITPTEELTGYVELLK